MKRVCPAPPPPPHTHPFRFAGVERIALQNHMMRMKAADLAASAKLAAQQPLMWQAMQPEERVPPLHEEFAKAGRCGWGGGWGMHIISRALGDDYARTR